MIRADHTCAFQNDMLNMLQKMQPLGCESGEAKLRSRQNKQARPHVDAQLRLMSLQRDGKGLPRGPVRAPQAEGRR